MIIKRIKQLGEAHRLARANYIPRVVGFGVAFIVITLLVLERNLSYWYFTYMVFSLLLYPHLAYLASRVYAGQKHVEISSMMMDALLTGIWVPLMQFYLWESFAFFIAIIITNTMTGGFRQMGKALLVFIVGVGIGGLLTGFEMNIEAPFYIDLASIITLTLFITNAARVSFIQTRRLASTRKKLENKNEMLNSTVQTLQDTRKELVEKAHKAGMADLASGVLHNIGNVLNSVSISTSVIKETIKKSKIPRFKEANELMKKVK